MIHGVPLTDQRPRHRGFVRTYDPRGTAKVEIRKDIQAQLDAGDVVRVSGPIAVTVLVFEAWPTSAGTAERNLYSHGVIARTSNKDVDNYAKLILDCCNGLLWDDDHDIVRLTVLKGYDDKPREEVLVEKEGETETEVAKAILSKISNYDVVQMICDIGQSIDHASCKDALVQIVMAHGDTLEILNKARKKAEGKI